MKELKIIDDSSVSLVDFIFNNELIDKSKVGELIGIDKT